jgi:uncharacterized C2H2 Zn-finger protein
LLFFFLFFSVLDAIEAKLTVEADGLVRCLVCGQPFTNNYNARRHVRTLHMAAGGVYRCALCDKLFEKVRSFDDHMRLKHGVYKNTSHLPAVLS